MKTIFCDVETVCLQPGPATIWELAVIVREDVGDIPGQQHCPRDLEYMWHIQPDLTHADPRSLGIGGYYERCTVSGHPPGSARLVTCPEHADMSAWVSAQDIARVVAPWFSAALVVGQIPWFDMGHLGLFLAANGECLASDYHLTDTGALVRGWVHGQGRRLPDRPVHLRDAVALAGLDAQPRYPPHRALSDARAVRDIYDVVTGWRVAAAGGGS